MKYVFLPLYVLVLCLFCSCDTQKTDQADGQDGQSPALNMGDLWEPNQRAGIDFIATGNEPFWSVEMDFDQRMVFSTPEAPAMLSMPVPAPDSLSGVPALYYRARQSGSALEVTIFPERCTDSMSGIEYPYRVTVSVKTGTAGARQDYTGCGRFKGDYRLHDIWALTEMDGRPVDAAEFPNGVPTLELHLQEGRVFGHGGCNEFSGSINVQGDRLTFSALTSTEMACPALAFETRYLAALSDRTLSYTVGEEGLRLSRDGHGLLFKKVD